MLKFIGGLVSMILVRLLNRKVVKKLIVKSIGVLKFNELFYMVLI